MIKLNNLLKESINEGSLYSSQQLIQKLTPTIEKDVELLKKEFPNYDIELVKNRYERNGSYTLSISGKNTSTSDNNKLQKAIKSKIKESINEEQHEKEMIDGIVEMLVQVKDIDNRKQMALDRLHDFKQEGIEVDAKQFLERCGLGSVNEKWSSAYKKSINCSNPKGFSQRAHCQGRKKKSENMKSKLTVEQKMELFLEKNCPTDAAKWSASKSAAKSKFDVYPSAYANGWAAKNYKAKGGGWRKCK